MVGAKTVCFVDAEGDCCSANIASVRPTHADGYEQEEGAHVSTPLVEE